MTNAETVKTLSTKSFARPKLKKLISTLDERSLKVLSDSGFSKDIRSYCRGRLKNIVQKRSIDRALEDISSYSMSINKASREHGVSVGIIREAVNSKIPDYDESKVRYKRAPKKFKIKDRLHLHKWDGSLVMKGEFFEEIKENI